MTGPERPCLILDVGDTLLRRSRPGPKRRVLLWLAEKQLIIAAQERAVADAILTAPDPATAAATLKSLLGLSERHANRLLSVMTSPEGDYALEPGALDLLRAARANGWRIIFASNAVQWAPPLPAPLHSQADTYVSSAQLGLSKHDPAFWRTLIESFAVNARWALSAGDSFSADVAPAQAAGLAALQIGADGVGLVNLTSALVRAGPPPKDAIGLLAGMPEPWGGRQIVSAPNLQSLVERATRTKVVLQEHGARTNSVIVRRAGGLPPVLAATDFPARVAMAWIAPRPDLRMRNVPRALEAALEAADLSLAFMAPEDRRHAISLVREASTAEIRDSRIRDIVTSLQAAATRRV